MISSYQHFCIHSCEAEHCERRFGDALHLLRYDEYLACDSRIGLGDLC